MKTKVLYYVSAFSLKADESVDSYKSESLDEMFSIADKWIKSGDYKGVILCEDNPHFGIIERIRY